LASVAPVPEPNLGRNSQHAKTRAPGAIRACGIGRVRDTYGVDVGPGEDAVLMICIAVCLDRIHEEEQHDRDL
jgi:hypothetical protein